MNAVEKLIAVAEAEVGYLEKESNSNLDDKTKNAGDANYTKYNRDLLAWTGVGKIKYEWCQAFVDWCFITAFGLENAKKLIYVWTNYTPTGSNAFKKKDRYIKRGQGKPSRGDVIYFYNKDKGRIGHVGIVYKVSSTKVYTIEGNTSGASELVTNGGGVKKKSYSLTSTYIDGYGIVDYSVVDDTINYLRRGNVGEAVKEMQKMLVGYDDNYLPKYGVDGDFGEETEDALKDFQAKENLEVTGVYDDKTKETLEKAVAQEIVEEPEPEPVKEPEPAKELEPKKKLLHVKITGGSVFVRTGAGTNGTKILGVAKKGDLLDYLQNDTNIAGTPWYNVSYKGQSAWVSGKYSKVVE